MCGEVFDHINNDEQNKTAIYNLFNDYESCIDKLGENLNKGDEIAVSLDSKLVDGGLEVNVIDSEMPEFKNYLKL